MRWTLNILGLWLGSAVLIFSARATVPDAPQGQYEAIPERNAFGLKPPPTEAPPTNPPAQLPRIILTGITTILGDKRALMMVQPVAPKPGEGKELSMILTEGQREGQIEVLRIDERRGSVRVNNSGTVMTLTFEKDGAKLPATSVVPSNAPVVPGSFPVPTGAPANFAPPPLPGSVRRLRTRTPQSPGLAVAPGTTSGTAAPVGGIPSPTGQYPAVTTPNPEVQVPHDLTPEEQAIVLDLQRQAGNNPAYPQQPSTGTAAAGDATGTGLPVAPGTLSNPATQRVLVPQ